MGVPSGDHRSRPALIGPTVADVWTVELAAPAHFDAGDWNLLAPDERQRANRLVREDDRARWVQARATLRRVLAMYLSADPDAIVFGQGNIGKPKLIEPQGTDLRFNASRSGSVAVFAVAVEREVGIDVERIDGDFAWERVAQVFLSPVELAAIHRRRTGEQCRVFFECWARKEAYLKGLGVGLTSRSTDCSLSFERRRAEVTDPARPEPAPERRWHLQTLDISEGYAVAVATEGDCTLVSRRL